MLDLHQVIGFECVARGDEVNNRIGQPRQRGQFHAAVELDQIHMHAFGRKKLARDRHILGRDFEAAALLDGARVIKISPNCHTDAALGDKQIQRLVEPRGDCAALPFGSVFDQGVFARDTQICAAVLDVSWHVRRAHHQHAHVGLVGRQNEFA